MKFECVTSQESFAEILCTGIHAYFYEVNVMQTVIVYHVLHTIPEE